MIYLSTLPTKNNRITSNFGGRPGVGYDGFHSGVDLGPITSKTAGDPIFAVQSGVIKIAGWYGGSYGNVIVIEHTQHKFCTLYAHLNSVNVSVDSQVNAGTVIGTMGNTGMSGSTYKAVHLHFEIRNILYKDWNGSRGSIGKTKCVDPAPYFSGVSSMQNGGMAYQDYPAIPENYDYERIILDQSAIVKREQLFGRKCRVMVFDKNGDGVDVSELHIIFNCTKTITLDNSVSTITIYNLNALTEGKIIETAERVTIEAGYEGAFGLIFDGDVIQVIRQKENGTDFRLDLIVMDGDRFLNQGFTAFTMSRGQTKRDVVNSIVSSASNPSKLGSISDSYKESKYIRGKVVFGLAKDYLNQLSKTENAKFYMENGTVNLVKINELPTNEMIKLDSESGLIDSPQQTDNGVNFKCLLTPRIKINSLVNIDNILVVERQYSEGSEMGRILDKDGVYRVIEMSYSGDTRGNDWHINCTAVSNMAGDLPQLLASQLVR